VLKPLKSDHCVVRPVRARPLESVELTRTIQIRSDCELASARTWPRRGWLSRKKRELNFAKGVQHLPRHSHAGAKPGYSARQIHNNSRASRVETSDRCAVSFLAPANCSYATANTPMPGVRGNIQQMIRLLAPPSHDAHSGMSEPLTDVVSDKTLPRQNGN
jgi:hypothetical protein